MISARDLAAKLASQCHGYPTLAPRFRGHFMGPRAGVRKHGNDWVIVAVDPYEAGYTGMGMVPKSIANLPMEEILANRTSWDWLYGNDYDRIEITWVKGACPMEYMADMP